jgi:uncharacterized protein (TIGR00369 family)
MKDDTDLFRFGVDALDSQPFSRLVGCSLEVLEPGRAVLRIPLRPEHRQQFGFVHGGVLSYAADNALTFAGGSMLGPNVLTSEFKINFIRPASGSMLIARAESVNRGRRQSVCVCNIHVVDGSGSELLCAIALGTIVATTPVQASGRPDVSP